MYQITLSLVTDRVDSEQSGRTAAHDAIRALRQAGILDASDAPTVTVEYVAAPVLIEVPEEDADAVRGFLAQRASARVTG